MMYSAVFSGIIISIVISTTHADDGPVSNLRTPPSCLTSSSPDSTCQWSSSRVSDFTYTACTKRVALTCWTWTPYLSLYRFCPGIGKDDCTEKCPENNSLQRTMYYDWVYNTCAGNGNWPDLPIGDLLNLPKDAAILPTDLSVKWPTCIKNDDINSQFQHAYSSTNEVRSWISSDSRTSTSKSYLFDQSFFCDDLVPIDVLGNTCGNSSSIDYTRALIWAHTYCGTYKDFEKERMPSNWQTNAPVYRDNGTYLRLDSLTSMWKDTKPDNYSDADMSSHIAGCPSIDLCNDLDSCSALVSVIRKDCFCANLDTCKTPNLGWCSRNVTGQLSLKNYFNKVCHIKQTSLPSDFLLRWNETTHVSPVNAITGWKTDSNAKCPSSRAKLTAFGLANLFALILVAGLGRRTVINKMTGSKLGRADLQLWYVTGILGVGFHLISNAINAAIVKKAPGYENSSFSHLFYLWCTRPRGAWLITALVCTQSGKAMYHSVTASTLITEALMQLISSGLMGMTTDFGRKIGLYRSMIRQYWDGFQHATKMMYVGSVLALVILSFCLAAVFWSVKGLKRRQQETPNYLSCIEYAAEGLDQRAVQQVENVRHIEAELESSRALQQPAASAHAHQPADMEAQFRHLRDQCSALLTDWQNLQSSVRSGPEELRKERRARVAELRSRGVVHEQGNDSHSQYLGNPARKVDQAKTNAQMAKREATNSRQSHMTILRQIDNTTADIQRLTSREQDLYTRISRLSNIDRSDRASQPPTQGTRSSNGPGSILSEADAYDDLLDRNEISLEALHMEYHHLAPRIEALNETKARYARLEPLYRDVGASWTELAQCYEQLTEEWSRVTKQRTAEANRNRPGWRYYGIPVVTIPVLLIAWIAQWLFWAGYVDVARDRYCPPKLVELTAVWVIFETLAAVIGACF